MNRHRHIRRAFVCAVFALPSCQERLPGGEKPPPVAWEGEHVQVATKVKLDAWCAGTLSYLDDYTGSVKDLFGAPDDFRVTYFLFPPPISDTGVCPARAEGCAFAWPGGGAAAAQTLPGEHEVVHAVGYAVTPMPPVFEEGAATYFGGLPRGSSIDFGDQSIRDLLDEHWDHGMYARDYALASDFTGFLVDTYGQQAYLQLRGETSEHQSRSDFERAFESVLGVTLEDAIAAYELEWMACEPQPLRRARLGCEAPGTAVVTHPDHDDGTLFDVDLSCEHPATVGPRTGADGVDRMWQDIVVDLEHTHEGTHLIDFKIDDAWMPPQATIRIEVKPCDRSCAAPGVQSFYPQPYYNFPTLDPNEFEAPSGRYVLRVSRSVDEPGPVRFRWR